MENLSKLLSNPEKYRTGENYRATNLVFPVEFNGKRYVVKKPRKSAFFIEAYYVLQDKFFLGTRRFSSATKRLGQEASKLERLAQKGRLVPKLAAHHRGILVRKYIEGGDFCHLLDREKMMALEGALRSLETFHLDSEVVGDAHIKNTLFQEAGVYWTGFNGVYDQSDLVQAKAADLLKFVYSIFTETRDHHTAVHAAELVAHNYGDIVVRSRIKNILQQKKPSSLRLWFPTRIPLNGKLNQEIQNVLTTS